MPVKSTKTPSRPYFSFSVKELVELFEKESSNQKILKQIKKELEHRSTPKAKDLEKKVLKRLDILQCGEIDTNEIEESNQYSLLVPFGKTPPPIKPETKHEPEETVIRITELEEQLYRRDEEVKRLQEKMEKKSQPLLIRVVESLRQLLGKTHGE